MTTDIATGCELGRFRVKRFVYSCSKTTCGILSIQSLEGGEEEEHVDKDVDMKEEEDSDEKANNDSATVCSTCNCIICGERKFPDQQCCSYYSE
jgi:hypothetical protein